MSPGRRQPRARRLPYRRPLRQNPDGPGGLAEGDRSWLVGNEPYDRNCSPYRATGFNADQRLRPLSFTTTSSRQGTGSDTPFLDAALPSLLVPGQYHADGQIDGESLRVRLLPSERDAQGRCHLLELKPHAAKLRAENNALCAQCRLPQKFDVTAHHKHSPGGPGAASAATCQAKNYMVVHDRRDHSMRVPRPDLSVSIGTPNACTQCHADRPAEWAAEVAQNGIRMAARTTSRLRHSAPRRPTGAVDAERQLDQLILDKSQPAIVRATGLQLLSTLYVRSLRTCHQGGDRRSGSMVRMVAPQALPPSAPRTMTESNLYRFSATLCEAVRVETAQWLLASTRR